MYVVPAITSVILPRIGCRLEMPPGFENLTWYGRGPWESYADRKEAAFAGIYNATVTDQWERYVLPQETGNKEEVRWMSLTDDSGVGLLFVAPDQMAASATHYRPEELYVNWNDRKKHSFEVPFCAPAIINLDARMRALGNASCGPDVLDQYELRAGETLFNFAIVPLKEAMRKEKLAGKARFTSPVTSPPAILRDEEGMVSLRSMTEGAQMYYRINGGKYLAYKAPFSQVKAATVEAYSEKDGRYRSPVTSKTLDVWIDKSKWKAVSCSSHASGDPASNVIDGDLNTIWHSFYGENEPRHPHEIVIDMGKAHTLSAFLYTGRQDLDHGRIRDYTLYLSKDGKTWNEAAKGRFHNIADRQVVPLKDQPVARYFKLVAHSAANRRHAWASAAELSVHIVK
jgi:beta-galactosidase